jgi:hypothetical protein
MVRRTFHHPNTVSASYGLFVFGLSFRDAPFTHSCTAIDVSASK